MNSHTSPVPSTTTTDAGLVAPPLGPPLPTRRRRAVLAGVGLLNCALPVMFTFNITRMLVTGVLPDHRYHQATGQGEILFALWLVPIVLMLRAGWHGRRPSTAAGLQHLVLIGAGVVTASIAPGGGAPFLVAVISVTGGLLWAVLPVRPQLVLRTRVNPLLAPVALAGTAVLLPYAADQLALQNAATTGFHSMNPHYFDQAWIAVTIAVMALAAAILPASRGLAGWVGGCSVVLGAAGLAFGESAPVHMAFLALGVLTTAAYVIARRDTARS
jgi:hypothetical protein